MKLILTIHILPNISRSKGNRTMKFGQLIEHNMSITLFLKNHKQKFEAEIIPRPFSKKSKLSISQWSKNLYSLFLLYGKLRSIEID